MVSDLLLQRKILRFLPKALGLLAPFLATAAPAALTLQAHEFVLKIQSLEHSYLELPPAMLQDLTCTAEAAQLQISPQNAARIHNTLNTAKSAGRPVSVRISNVAAEACRIEAVYYLEMIQ